MLINITKIDLLNIIKKILMILFDNKKNHMRTGKPHKKKIKEIWSSITSKANIEGQSRKKINFKKDKKKLESAYQIHDLVMRYG
jgi:hypothetical protein